MFFFFFFLRGDRRGDFPRRVSVGGDAQIHLQQEGDVSEPGGKSCAAWRRPRVSVQQSGGLSERHQSKPKGVFYLAGVPDLALTWQERERRPHLLYNRDHRAPPQPPAPVDQQNVKKHNNLVNYSPFFVNTWHSVNTDKGLGSLS